MGAAPMSSDVPVPSVADLADQVADVLHFFRWREEVLLKSPLSVVEIGK